MSVTMLPPMPVSAPKFEKQPGPKAVAETSPAYQSVRATLAQMASHAHGDFRDELFQEGVVVVKRAIPLERAEQYAGAAYTFLESFGLGFDRNDSSTWKSTKLPFSHRGGLYNGYGCGHEEYAWQIRQEPGIIDAFAKIWGTNELLVSFDGLNISLPQKDAAKDVHEPWPHVDQSPTRQFLHCVQGIANLAPNGPLDGGLMVLRGSKELYNECFAKFDHQKPEGGWTLADSYHHTPEMLDWMINEKGCYWEKIVAEPGDLILWDSRTVHYGAAPLGDNPRIATYVSYKPAKLASDDTYAQKRKAFEQQLNCTHDATAFQILPGVEPTSNDAAWKVRQKPASVPVLSAVGRKLAGLDRY